MATAPEKMCDDIAMPAWLRNLIVGLLVMIVAGMGSQQLYAACTYQTKVDASRANAELKVDMLRMTEDLRGEQLRFNKVMQDRLGRMEDKIDRLLAGQ